MELKIIFFVFFLGFLHALPTRKIGKYFDVSIRNSEDIKIVNKVIAMIRERRDLDQKTEDNELLKSILYQVKKKKTGFSDSLKKHRLESETSDREAYEVLKNFGNLVVEQLYPYFGNFTQYVTNINAEVDILGNFPEKGGLPKEKDVTKRIEKINVASYPEYRKLLNLPVGCDKTRKPFYTDDQLFETEELPTQVEVDELPTQIEVDELPTQIEVDELPTQVEEVELPTRIEVDELPTQVEVDELPTQVEVDELPTQVEVDELPTRIEVDELPTQVEVDELPTQVKEDVKHPTQVEVDEHPTQADGDEHSNQAELDELPIQAKIELPTQAELDELPTQAELNELPPQAELDELPAQAELDKLPVQSKGAELSTRPKLNRLPTQAKGDQLFQTEKNGPWISKDKTWFVYDEARRELYRLSQGQNERVWFEYTPQREFVDIADSLKIIVDMFKHILPSNDNINISSQMIDSSPEPALLKRFKAIKHSLVSFARVRTDLDL